MITTSRIRHRGKISYVMLTKQQRHNEGEFPPLCHIKKARVTQRRRFLLVLGQTSQKDITKGDFPLHHTKKLRQTQQEELETLLVRLEITQI